MSAETRSPRTRLDLHMHTSRSDGRFPPAEVLRRCALGGLDAIAITDHDLPPPLAAGVYTVGERALTVIHGVEISAMHRGVELHLLAYFPGTMPISFADFCTNRAISRADRYASAVAAMGLPDLPPPDAAARAGERALTRLHLAQALVAAGHATGLGDAFLRWAGEAAGYVPDLDLALVDAIGRVREEGGFSAWAHPDPDQAAAWTGELARAGLHALEVHRPGIGKGQREVLARLAFKHRLSVTGGSDWHGWHAGELGAFSFPLRQADAFARAVGLC